MRINRIFVALLGVNFLLLVAQIQGVSISSFEAGIVYGNSSLLNCYSTFFLHLFGFNDYVLRLPMIALHLLSATLLYGISGYYLSRPTDKLWVLLIYLLLPGVTSAALLLNIAGFKILAIFTFVYTYLRFGQWSLLLLPLFITLDSTSIYLYFTVALYSLVHKKYVESSLSLSLLLGSIFVWGINVGGVPKGHFLDALGIYAAIFSPLVFIYLFYVLYRRYISNERDLIWMIASSMFIISLLLSFRQKATIQDFAPYLMVALPLAAQTFLHTYRVRLPQFRGRYRILFYSAFSLLVINGLAVFFNQWLYMIVQKPKSHFSYPMHVAKELANELHREKTTCLKTNEQLQGRLRFYGISQCEATILSETAIVNAKKVTISYINIPIYAAYVTKVNK